MDPVTHALLGASVQEAGLRQKIGRDAAIAGMLAGIAPDSDIIMLYFGQVFFTNPQEAMIFGHRGVTHSIAAVVVFPLVIATAWYFIRTAIFRRKLPRDRKPASFGLLYLCCLLGVMVHVLLDACTSYGTMLYWPFSTRRIAWDCVAIIDPLFTIIPAAVLFICWLVRRRTGEFSEKSVSRTQKIGRWGLGLCVWYMLLGLAIHYSVMHRSLTGQPRDNIIQAGAFPVIPSLARWRVVWETPDGWHIAEMRAFARKPVKLNYVPVCDEPLVKKSRESQYYKAFCSFTGRMLRADVRKHDGMTDVYFHDMRYGWPVDSPDGLWAYLFRYDDNGHLIWHGRVYPDGRKNVLDRFREMLKD